MNTTLDDGGPAFPNTAKPMAGEMTEWGMSLRDWFAGMALPAIYKLGCGDITEAEMALDAYRVADEMLAARKEAR